MHSILGGSPTFRLEKWRETERTGRDSVRPTETHGELEPRAKAVGSQTGNYADACTYNGMDVHPLDSRTVVTFRSGFLRQFCGWSWCLATVQITWCHAGTSTAFTFRRWKGQPIPRGHRLASLRLCAAFSLHRCTVCLQPSSSSLKGNGLLQSGSDNITALHGARRMACGASTNLPGPLEGRGEGIQFHAGWRLCRFLSISNETRMKGVGGLSLCRRAHQSDYGVCALLWMKITHEDYGRWSWLWSFTNQSLPLGLITISGEPANPAKTQRN